MRPFMSRLTNCHSVITPPRQQAIVGNTHKLYIFYNWQVGSLMGCPNAVNIQQYYTMPLFTIIVELNCYFIKL